MPFCRSLLSLLVICVAGCSRGDTEHGFTIFNVGLQQEYRRLHVSVSQDLRFSREAVDALQHGVPLTLSMDMELRESSTLTLLADDSKLFEIRYLPLSQHYQLIALDSGESRTFPRLRHAVSQLASLKLAFETGPLAPGEYEFRTRMRLVHSSLPAPMHLPALMSAQWQHDSEWSTWPFEINA